MKKYINRKEIEWHAVIPLRSGSKGLHNKNIKDLAGKPLFKHTLDIAIESEPSSIIISTNINCWSCGKHIIRICTPNLTNR